MEFDTSYESLVEAIDTLIEEYNVSAVCLDGMTGAGMDRLADAIATRYGAPIIHMRDFILPEGERAEGWEHTPAGDIDFNRFREEIADPWMGKAPLVYTIVDPVTGEPIERRALPDARLYIIEGTYCLHPYIPDFFDLRIFMKCSPGERLAVNGMTALRASLEDQYFVTYMTELLSDVVLDEAFYLPPEEEDAAPQEEEKPARPDYSFRNRHKQQ